MNGTTCPICGVSCAGWWELLHIHTCEPVVDGDPDSPEQYVDDDPEGLADYGYYGGINNDWLR